VVAADQQHFFIGRDDERKRSKRKLRHLALYDQLTGLPNRISLSAILKPWSIWSCRPSGIDFDRRFDLDDFKNITTRLAIRWRSGAQDVASA